MKPIHWLAVIPFIGMLVGPAVHNEVDPLILGVPFPLGWDHGLGRADGGA